MQRHARTVIRIAVLIAVSGCSNLPPTEEPLKTEVDVYGAWHWLRLWKNGSDGYPVGQGWILSRDGILAMIADDFPNGVNYGRFNISKDMDSIHVIAGIAGVADLHAGMRFLKDTLILTSYTEGYGAYRLYMKRMDFTPVDTADGLLRLSVEHYSYSKDGTSVKVVGTMVNESEHDFLDVHGEFQIYDRPNMMEAVAQGQMTNYRFDLPYVLAHAAIPFERDIQTPQFVRAKGQNLYGWQVIVYTKARGLLPLTNE